MTTLYIQRVTIASPVEHLDDANALALILGDAPADINTFNYAGYQVAALGLEAVPIEDSSL